MIFKGLAPLI